MGRTVGLLCSVAAWPPPPDCCGVRLPFPFQRDVRAYALWQAAVQRVLEEGGGELAAAAAAAAAAGQLNALSSKKTKRASRDSVLEPPRRLLRREPFDEKQALRQFEEMQQQERAAAESAAAAAAVKAGGVKDEAASEAEGTGAASNNNNNPTTNNAAAAEGGSACAKQSVEGKSLLAFGGGGLPRTSALCGVAFGSSASTHDLGGSRVDDEDDAPEQTVRKPEATDSADARVRVLGERGWFPVNLLCVFSTDSSPTTRRSRKKRSARCRPNIPREFRGEETTPT